MPGAAAQDSAGGWSWSSPSPSESSRNHQSHPTLGPAGHWCEGRSTRLAQRPLLVLQNWAVPSPGPSSQGHGAVNTDLCKQMSQTPQNPGPFPHGCHSYIYRGKMEGAGFTKAGWSGQQREVAGAHCRTSPWLCHQFYSANPVHKQPRVCANPSLTGEHSPGTP